MENVSLKDGNMSFSEVSPYGIYFTMAHSTAGDALAYSDGANLEGAHCHEMDNETAWRYTWQTGQSEEHQQQMWNMHWNVGVTVELL